MTQPIMLRDFFATVRIPFDKILSGPQAGTYLLGTMVLSEEKVIEMELTFRAMQDDPLRAPSGT